MLSDLVSESSILLNVEASDWRDSIRKAAKPLLEQKKASASYVDEIIKSAEESGPYFVIMPHVALPHARPEMGALDNAIGIATLKTPVHFGSQGNDPVKYLFTLCATGTNEHVEALMELSNLLESGDIYQILDQAQSSKEVLDYIKNKCNNKTSV